MVAGRGSLLATFKNQPLSCLLRCTLGVRVGSFSSDRPAPDALGMSASLRSRPNLRTAANRRGVPGGDHCGAAKASLLDHLVGNGEHAWRNRQAERLRGL